MHCVLDGHASVRCGTSCYGMVCCVAARLVMGTTYTVGVVAASMLQGGICLGGLGSVMTSPVLFWLCVARTTIVLARRPINAAVVGSHMARQITFGQFLVGQCSLRRVASRLAALRQVRLRSGNHTRAGTVPDRRGRCGLDHGMARSGVLRPVNAGRCLEGQVAEGPVYKPSSCRHGAGSTPAAWDGLRQVTVGLGLLRSVGARSDGAGQVCARFGESWH